MTKKPKRKLTLTRGQVQKMFMAIRFFGGTVQLPKDGVSKDEQERRRLIKVKMVQAGYLIEYGGELYVTEDGKEYVKKFKGITDAELKSTAMKGH